MKKKKDILPLYLRCMDYVEKMEKSGDLLINTPHGGMVMTLTLWQAFFTEGYLHDGDERRFLGLCDKVRAVINFRRGYVSGGAAQQDNTQQQGIEASLLAPDQPLLITVASAIDPSKPLFVGFQQGCLVKVEEYHAAREVKSE